MQYQSNPQKGKKIKQGFNVRGYSAAKKVALTAILIALALIFSYVEAMVPVNIAIPGVKLGIANIVVILALYLIDFRAGVLISIIRILLSGLLFSGPITIIFSLGGAVLSLAIMAFLKQTNKFTIVGVSMAGGVAHNIGQLIVASLFMGTANIFLYFPVLLFSGMTTGIVIGIIAYYIMRAYMSSEQ